MGSGEWRDIKGAMRGQKKVFFYDTLANMMSEDSFGISFQEPKLF